MEQDKEGRDGCWLSAALLPKIKEAELEEEEAAIAKILFLDCQKDVKHPPATVTSSSSSNLAKQGLMFLLGTDVLVRLGLLD